MKKILQQRLPCALLAVLLISSSAAALFGLGDAETAGQPQQGPVAQAQKIKTYQDIPYSGQLTAEQEEGETVTFALEKAPGKGTVTLQEDGSFVYQPKQGKSGKDSFTFTAADAQGRISRAATVQVTLNKRKSGVTYRDMENNEAYPAAIALAEKGIFTGMQVGENHYFEPQAPVSRAEFLAMAMTMAGMQALENVTVTGFYDDELIPVWAKDYASAALQSGIVEGIETPDGVSFSADADISRLEAATVLNRILQVTDVSLESFYEEKADIPDWAAQAVANMEAVHVIAAGSFDGEQLQQGVSRAEAAEMLAVAMEILDSGKKEKGFFDWLK